MLKSTARPTTEALPGGRVMEDIRRDQMLISAGWKVKRFWVYELREDMERCVKDIANCYAD